MSHCSGLPSIRTLLACHGPWNLGTHPFAMRHLEKFRISLKLLISNDHTAPCSVFFLIAGNNGATYRVQLHLVYYTFNVNFLSRFHTAL